MQISQILIPREGWSTDLYWFLNWEGHAGLTRIPTSSARASWFLLTFCQLVRSMTESTACNSQADYTALIFFFYAASTGGANMFSSTTKFLSLQSSRNPLLPLKQGKGCKWVFVLWLSKHWNILHIYSVISAGSVILSPPHMELFAGKLLLLCMSLLCRL